MEYEICECENDEAQHLCEQLISHNLNCVGPTQQPLFIPVRLKIADENHRIIAGCLGEIYCWNVMCIDLLWVDQAYRGRGLGTMLLRKMEKIAREKNCSLIHLDTFDFQARDFYAKFGYQVFGILDDCPQEHRRYYMKKIILPQSSFE